MGNAGERGMGAWSAEGHEPSLACLPPSLAHPVSNAPLAPSPLSSTFRVLSLSYISLSSLSPWHAPGIASHRIKSQRDLHLEPQSLRYSSNLFDSNSPATLHSVLVHSISNVLSALRMDVRFWSVCLVEPSSMRRGFQRPPFPVPPSCNGGIVGFVAIG